MHVYRQSKTDRRCILNCTQLNYSVPLFINLLYSVQCTVYTVHQCTVYFLHASTRIVVLPCNKIARISTVNFMFKQCSCTEQCLKSLNISRDSELMLYFVLNYGLFFTELCFKMLYFLAKMLYFKGYVNSSRG